MKKILYLLFIFTITIYCQKRGSTATDTSSVGWDSPHTFTPTFHLPVYRLLSNPGGWINKSQYTLDSTLAALLNAINSNPQGYYLNPDDFIFTGTLGDSVSINWSSPKNISLQSLRVGLIDTALGYIPIAPSDTTALLNYIEALFENIDYIDTNSYSITANTYEGAYNNYTNKTSNLIKIFSTDTMNWKSNVDALKSGLFIDIDDADTIDYAWRTGGIYNFNYGSIGLRVSMENPYPKISSKGFVSLWAYENADVGNPVQGVSSIIGETVGSGEGIIDNELAVTNPSTGRAQSYSMAGLELELLPQKGYEDANHLVQGLIIANFGFRATNGINIVSDTAGIWYGGSSSYGARYKYGINLQNAFFDTMGAAIRMGQSKSANWYNGTRILYSNTDTSAFTQYEPNNYQYDFVANNQNLASINQSGLQLKSTAHSSLGHFISPSLDSVYSNISNDTLAVRTYSNLLYQTNATYLIPSDSTAFRTFSNLLLNTDTALYLSKAQFNADTSLFETKTLFNAQITQDTNQVRTFSNSKYQAAGSYALTSDTTALLNYVQILLNTDTALYESKTLFNAQIVADTNALRTFSNSKYQTTGTYLIPSDSTSLLNYINAKLNGYAILTANTFSGTNTFTGATTPLDVTMGSDWGLDGIMISNSTQTGQLQIKVGKNQTWVQSIIETYSDTLDFQPKWNAEVPVILIGHDGGGKTFIGKNSGDTTIVVGLHSTGTAKFDAAILLPASMPTDSTTCASGQVYLKAGAIYRKY